MSEYLKNELELIRFNVMFSDMYSTYTQGELSFCGRLIFDHCLQQLLDLALRRVNLNKTTQK